MAEGDEEQGEDEGHGDDHAEDSADHGEHGRLVRVDRDGAGRRGAADAKV
ncbi:MAG: hypothetical protein AMXMBFR53_32880 [Gemmatimonadota bacterium]